MKAKRKQTILRHINPATQKGIEIGPLDRPILSKAEAQVYFVDYTSLERLQEIHRTSPGISPENICKPDFIAGADPLSLTLKNLGKIDYVIASHVIEHVPDMVRWFKDLAALLKDQGIVSLVVPDKRFTFDLLRPVSSAGDVLEAYWAQAQRPALGQVWDTTAMAVNISAVEAWQGAHSGPYRYSLKDAQDSVEHVKADPSHYFDCHCWVLTPKTLIEIWKCLSELDLFDFEILDFQSTKANELEFFVSLRKVDSNQSRSEQLKAQLTSFSRWKFQDNFRRLNPLINLFRRAFRKFLCKC